MCLTLLLTAGPARAQSSLPASLAGVGFDQKLSAQVPLDLEFRDEAGRAVRLGDYFHGKPVILVLAWYRCPMLCSELLNGLTQALMDLPFDVGDQFDVVTVSFDPQEGPDLAAAKKATYLKRYGKPGAENGWHFLTGSADSSKRLADAVGFRYRWDEKHQQYAHASGITVLTPSGRVSRYFYDVRFVPRDLRLGLVEASEGRIGSPVDQVLLYCFHYDPAEGKYGPAVMNLVRLGGVVTLLGVVIFAGVLWRREWRRSRALATPR